jgi:Polyketide cyclase / dehydrase and lipid transport
MRERDRTIRLESHARTPSDPANVMAHLLDPSSWPAWQTEIIATNGPAPLGRGDVVTGTARMLGFDGVQGRSVAVDVGEAVFEEDVVVGIGMRIRYEVKADGNGSRVIHRLESDLPRGFSGRLLSFMLRRRLKGLQKRALQLLVMQAERGEIQSEEAPAK